jgi:hypothetical protein
VINDFGKKGATSIALRFKWAAGVQCSYEQETIMRKLSRGLVKMKKICNMCRYRDVRLMPHGFLANAI